MTMQHPGVWRSRAVIDTRRSLMRRRGWSRLGVILIEAVFIIAGCSTAATTAPSAATPAPATPAPAT